MICYKRNLNCYTILVQYDFYSNSKPLPLKGPPNQGFLLMKLKALMS